MLPTVFCGPFFPLPSGGVAERGGDFTSAESGGADLGFVVRAPVADFKFQQPLLAVRHVEFVRDVKHVGRGLVIVKHHVRADGRDAVRIFDAQSPARHVEFMNALIAEVAVTRVPHPMPVVVKAILGERLQGRGTGPEVVMDAGGHRFFRSVADGVAPLVAQAAREIDVANQPVLHLLHALDNGLAGAAVGAVLNDAVIFFHGAHQLAALPRVVAHGLFNVNVLAGLAAPNGLQRVPVVGRGDGNRVDGLVFQKFAQVDESGGFLDPHLFHLAHAAIHDVLIHVADGGDFNVRHLGILLDVRPSLPVQSDHGNPHAVVGPENPFRFGEKADPPQSRQTGPGSCGVLMKSRRLISESLDMRNTPLKVCGAIIPLLQWESSRFSGSAIARPPWPGDA